ncbi:MAG: hypothetical protein U0176_24555 [Bacteroidia bacterium]
MGKRTIRIPGNDLGAQMERLQGAVAQVVTKAGITHAGTVLSVNASELVIQDVNAAWTSKKRHQQQIAVDEIDYVALDIVTAW